MADDYEPIDEDDEDDEEVEEALYTVNFVSGGKPPEYLPGLKQISADSYDDKVFTSEWLMVEPRFEEIVPLLATFDVRMKQFRMHKPIKEQWCVVDWEWIQMAIDSEFTLEI